MPTNMSEQRQQCQKFGKLRANYLYNISIEECHVTSVGGWGS